jgi:hypothetical protein
VAVRAMQYPPAPNTLRVAGRAGSLIPLNGADPERRRGTWRDVVECATKQAEPEPTVGPPWTRAHSQGRDLRCGDEPLH